MLTQENNKGIIRYSIIFVTLPPPNEIPRIFIASHIEPYSSLIVGKNLITTARDMDIPSGTCIFCMADMNSPIFVVRITYHAVIIAGMNCATIPQYPIRKAEIKPVDSDDMKNFSRISAAAYKTEKRNADEYFPSVIISSIGTSVTAMRMPHSKGVTAFTITINDTANIMNSFVRGSSDIFIILCLLFQNAF